MGFVFLTFSWQSSLSYKNQSIDLLWKLNDWFLYNRDLRHERVKMFKQKWFNFVILSSQSTSYLLHVTYKELLNITAKTILQQILLAIKSAKYYPIYVDSTSDISHTNQLTFNMRYVLGTAPVERLLYFIPMESHKRKEIATIMFGFLRDNKIPFQSCRGQFNGNASNMSEKSRCKYAEFVPYMALSV